MRMIFLSLAGLFLLELFTAFVIYPLKSKKRDRRSYYWVVKNSIYRFDHALGYTLKPNLRCNNPTTPIATAPRKVMNFDLRTDRNGFLSTEDVAAIKGREKLIFCLGDSITMGSESPHDRTFPSILDALLQRCGRRCVNASVGGYRSYHQLLFLKNKILPYKPEAVILYTGWNDYADHVYDFYKPYDRFRSCLSYGLPTNRLEAFLDHSALFHITKKILHSLKNDIRSDFLSEDRKARFAAMARSGLWMKEWVDNIGQMIGICKDNHIACYILSCMAPVYKSASVEAKELADKELNMCGNFDTYVDFIDAANSTLSRLAKEEGASFIDIRADMDGYCTAKDGCVDYRKRFLLFVDRAHLSEEGNALVAKAVFNKIERDLL